MLNIVKSLLNKKQRPQTPPGRNEQCWCGSGKKYKKCHSEIDRVHYSLDR